MRGKEMRLSYRQHRSQWIVSYDGQWIGYYYRQRRFFNLGKGTVKLFLRTPDDRILEESISSEVSWDDAESRCRMFIEENWDKETVPDCIRSALSGELLGDPFDMSPSRVFRNRVHLHNPRIESRLDLVGRVIVSLFADDKLDVYCCAKDGRDVERGEEMTRRALSEFRSGRMRGA